MSKNKDEDQIINIAKSNIESLVSKINQEELHSDLHQKFWINSDSSIEEEKVVQKSHLSWLNHDLLVLQHFPRSKNKRYTKEELDELGQILDNYPNDHITIRKDLKIPHPLL